MHLQYESTHSYATSVLSALQNTPNFRADSKVAFVGEYAKPQSLAEQYSYLTGIYGLEGITPNTYSIANLFEYYCGVRLNIASASERHTACATPEFQQMPTFPGNGSVREINGIFIVRLS